MKRILEHASRALAILGIALIVWAGMGVQTAKADPTGWPNPCYVVYTARVATGCAGWRCEAFKWCCSQPWTDDTNGTVCCWLVC
jgi:hypothetical protein